MWSEQILARLEKLDLFNQAQRILFYHALPDEVQTAGFLDKWRERKTILLPVVCGNELQVVPFDPNRMKPGCFGILEPTGPAVDNRREIDLILVPGVAFDRNKNRLGRGRGYYDRLFERWRAPRIGICFGFQLLDQVPVEPHDVQMNGILTESEFIE